MRKIAIAAMVLALVAGMLMASPQSETAKASEAKKILWWSHWANEPSKVETIERVAKDYMAANPNVNIENVWWDKNPLRDAFRAAMTAGSKEVADIVTVDTPMVPQYADAGWLVSLDAIPADRFVPGAVAQGTYKGSLYKYNIGKSINMVFFNPAIMNELGIKVPSSNQFDRTQYLDSVKKASAAGYAGAANAIGNRPYPAEMVVRFLMATMVTDADEWSQYWRGKKSWGSPPMKEVLTFFAELGKAGFWPESFTTMTIDEFHVYFHTQRKSLYLWIPSWYTGRSFKPESEGGQDPDWHMGMMLYPKLAGAKDAGALLGGFESGYGVTSANPDNEATAIDILAFMAQPKYGALWEAKTAIPSAVRNTPADKPSDVPEGPWGWYTSTIADVYGDAPVLLGNLAGMSGDMKDAIKSNVNEGIPQGLVTVDKAIENIDKAAGLR